jgi:phospholipid/cholesterol/gamma-HCH transport system substrate-binding protein
MTPIPSPAPPPPGRSPAAHLEFKAGMLLMLFVALVLASAAYLLYARGAFESKQRLVLLADNSEGVRVGMDLTFSGFPIGRVNRIELAEDGTVRIVVDVPRDDARWLRTSSVFTLSRGLVGGANLRAYSGMLSDPPLAEGAERRVLIGDTAAELPPLVSAAREAVQNLTRLSAADSSLAASLANLQAFTEQLNGERGAVGALLGSDNADARELSAALQRVNALLARVDGMARKADEQLLGRDGVVPASRATVEQLNGLIGDARAVVPAGKATVDQLNALLGDARGTLQKVDGVLAEAQAVAANARVATTDLGALRSEVDATLRQVEQLVNEVNRKWPFARETQLQLK